MKGEKKKDDGIASERRMKDRLRYEEEKELSKTENIRVTNAGLKPVYICSKTTSQLHPCVFVHRFVDSLFRR